MNLAGCAEMVFLQLPFADRLRRITGVTFCLENLNTVVDHPGVPLARAKDTLALVEAVGSPRVRMIRSGPPSAESLLTLVIGFTVLFSLNLLR